MVMNIPPEEIQQEREHLASTLEEISIEAAKIRQSLPSQAAHQQTANLQQQNRLAELAEMEAMQIDPYFGRIVYQPAGQDTLQSVYIGRYNFRRLGANDVSSWGAPIARLYYQPNDGRWFVEGQERNARVTLKRELTIEESRLTAVSDVLRLEPPPEALALAPSPAGPDTGPLGAGPDIALQARLSETGERELGEIVATIQPAQYSIIAEAQTRVMIVQGAAGSGKSEIGQHRLAWLLHPSNGLSDRDRPRASRVLMIGPSLAFLHYARNLLPRLGAQPILQSTLREWLLQRFSRKPRLSPENPLLQDLMRNPPRRTHEDWEAERFKGSLEMKRIIDRYVRRRKGKPLGHFIYEYRKMVDEDLTLRQRGVVANRPLLDTDLAPMLYLDHLLNESPRQQYEHIVIDEAQDISPLEVHLLSMHSRNGWFTILGDIRQRLTPYRGVRNWQELQRVFPQGDVRRYEARYSYRSTSQITKLGNRILRRLPEQGDQPIPHTREGDPPRLHRSGSVHEMYAAIAARAQEGLGRNYTVTILTRTSQNARDALRYLEDEGIAGAQVLSANGVIESDLVISPILLTKGLEFDMVLIAGVDAKSFTGSEMDNRLLYLATTRARHHLEIHWVERPSPLIRDLGAVGMDIAGRLDASRGKRSVFDRFK